MFPRLLAVFFLLPANVREIMKYMLCCALLWLHHWKEMPTETATERETTKKKVLEYSVCSARGKSL